MFTQRMIESAALAATLMAVASGCGYTQYKDASAPVSDGAPPASTGTGTSTSNPGGGAPTTTPTGNPTPAPTVTQVSFQQVSQQILQPKCLSCHSGGNSPNLSSYAGFATNSSYVVAGNPAQSALYNAVKTGTMPQGGSPLSATQVQMIYDWIEQGAQNN